MEETLKPKNTGYLASISNFLSLSILLVYSEKHQEWRLKKTYIFFQCRPEAMEEKKKTQVMGGTGREQRGVRRQQGAREARLPKKPNSTE